MTLFNLGDQVRVTGDTAGLEHEFVSGHVGFVTDIDRGADVEVDGKWWVHPKDLELLAAEATSEQVDHPPHYTWLKGIEVIDITEQLTFTMGNIIKYVLRADHKGKPIEDLRKARFYLDREIARREKGEDA
jgi:hypothetical protein